MKTPQWLLPLFERISCSKVDLMMTYEVGKIDHQ